MKKSDEWIKQHQVDAVCEKMLEERSDLTPGEIKAPAVAARLGIEKPNGRMYHLVYLWRRSRQQDLPPLEIPHGISSQLNQSLEMNNDEVRRIFQFAMSESVLFHERQAAVKVEAAERRALDAEDLMGQAFETLSEADTQLQETQSELEMVRSELQSAQRTIFHLHGRIEQMERIQQIAPNAYAMEHAHPAGDTPPQQELVERSEPAAPFTAQQLPFGDAETSTTEVSDHGHRSVNPEGSDTE